MPPKQANPTRELQLLLSKARLNSRNPLLVKIVDWAGDTAQSVFLADADSWICSRLQGMTTTIAEYLRVPQVIVVNSLDDPDAGIGIMTRLTMRDLGTHHLVVTQDNDGKVTNIAFYTEEE